MYWAGQGKLSARTNLEGREKLSSRDLRKQITLSQSRHETQDKSCEQSLHSKAPKSSHPRDSQAATERFGANSPIVRKLIGWLNKEGEARSQGTQKKTSQGESEVVESQGRISVHKRMRKSASQRLGPRTEESGENYEDPSNEDTRDILKLRKEMEELKRQIDRDGSFGPTVEVISPFTSRVMKAKLPRGMKAPEIRYRGVTDPNDHLAAYQTHMLMHAVEDEIQCRLFVGTLEGPAVKWFLTLPNGTIYCFKDLAQLFLNAYGGRFQPKKHFTHLFSLKQKEGETNTELVQRWNEAINEVEPMDDKTSIALFMSVLRSGELFRRDAQPQQQVQENSKEFPQVGVIFGGPEMGVTNKERKEWARRLYVGSVDVGQVAKKGRQEPIVFSDEDFPFIPSSHRTPVVISMAIHKFFVKRILVDTGSSVNVLYREVAQQLGIRKEDLTRLNMPLSGRPGLEDLGGALSLEHLCLKFRTPQGIGRALGDQPAAKKAYLNACKKIDKENPNIQTIGQALENKERKEEDRERPKPAVEMEEVMLFPDGDPEKFMFRATNNEAEYEALIGGIPFALFMKIKNIRLKSDSKLAIGQLKGEMEAKEGRLKRYRDCARTLLGKFEYYELIYVPREENEEAYMLAKLCRTVPVHMESMVRQHENTCLVWEEEVHVLEITGPSTRWMSPLFTYLEKGELPVDPKEARRVQLMAPKYQLDGGRLYKRTLGGPMLKCLSEREAGRILEEVHQGVCSAHQGALTLERKVILPGFYWPTLKKDALELLGIGSCEKGRKVNPLEEES
ncbi:unnamed protein product [Cuscuta campestris]|uniref:Uncharacterized protein n=1 Tax=Cuscuta campestris TaxID=132261 RepID=A0A484M895_9ASTE|nr:unnamed protein product [Cuscuta campestris]